MTVTEAVGELQSTKTAATRQRLLEAARLGVARFGTRKLSMTDVAELAKVSRRTLYRYFPSMELLLDALGEDETRRFDAAVTAVVRDRPRGQRLAAVLHFMTASLSDDHLQQLVSTEPAFVLERFSAVLPPMRARLTELILQEAPPGSSPRQAEDVADAAIRLAMSHYLLPEADATRFERSIAGLVNAALSQPIASSGNPAP